MVKQQSASLHVIQGPQKGDSIALTPGTCRLIGRHLSEGETIALDQNGQRIVHQSGVAMVTNYLKGVQTAMATPAGSKVQHKSGDHADHQDPDITGDGTFTRGADVIVGDEAISRAHAIFYYDQSQIIGVVDLGSRNGTRVNGKPVSTAVLRDGDEIALGSTVLRIALT